MNIFGIDIYGSIRDSGSFCSLSQHLKMSNTKQHIKICHIVIHTLSTFYITVNFSTQHLSGFHRY